MGREGPSGRWLALWRLTRIKRELGDSIQWYGELDSRLAKALGNFYECVFSNTVTVLAGFAVVLAGFQWLQISQCRHWRHYRCIHLGFAC